MLHKSLNWRIYSWRIYVIAIQHSVQLISAPCLCFYGNGLTWVSTQPQIAEYHLASALLICLYCSYMGFSSLSLIPVLSLSFAKFPSVLNCFPHSNVVVSYPCMFKWLLPADYLTPSTEVCLCLNGYIYLHPFYLIISLISIIQGQDQIPSHSLIM